MDTLKDLRKEVGIASLRFSLYESPEHPDFVELRAYALKDHCSDPFATTYIYSETGDGWEWFEVFRGCDPGAYGLKPAPNDVAGVLDHELATIQGFL